jgi:hypothetical protein
MKYFLSTKEDNIVNGYSDIQYTEFPHEYDFSTSEITFNDFLENIGSYRIINGQLIKDSVLVVRREERIKEEELEYLKGQRSKLFRDYIDRSPMFYNTLSEERIRELEVWYQKWCDMPEAFTNGTWVEPTLPTWL